MVLVAHMEISLIEPDFSGIILFLAKMTRNGQKWPRNVFFGLFVKIRSLVLSEIGVEWKYFWPFHSQVMAENALSQSDFSIL